MTGAVSSRVALVAAIVGLACLGGGATATAGTVSGWWGGMWACTIDGRPARMQWSIVADSQGGCDGEGNCTQTSGVKWSGRFSDNGSRWVPLTNAREGTKGGVFFRHADGNQWYLGKPAGNATTGYTTWQGKRYPLSCRR